MKLEQPEIPLLFSETMVPDIFFAWKEIFSAVESDVKSEIKKINEISFFIDHLLPGHLL